jgi:hypothetical protein
MLASITPLGERGRGRRWGVTVVAHLVGAVLSGGAIGGLLGLVAAAPVRTLGSPARLGSLAIAAAAGVVLDTRVGGLRLPTPVRQVNEEWMSRYRGWVYGFGFGIQLGSGVATIVTTSAVYVMLVAAGLSGRAGAGAAIGATFGLVRGATILAGAGVTHPRQLVRVDEVLRRWNVRSLVATLLVQSGISAALVAGAIR